MGKAKGRGRLHSVRVSPIDATQREWTEELKEGPRSLTTERVEELKEEVMTSLLSQRPAERECGALLLANLLQANHELIALWMASGLGAGVPEAGTSKQLKSHLADMVRTLAPLLVDPNENVRSSCSEALSRLASSISEEVALLMVDLDVLTPVITCFEKFFGSADWVEAKQMGQSKKIFASLCDVVGSLCAKSSKALKIFNGSKLTSFLTTTVMVFEKCIRSAVAAAECLVVVSEDNLLLELRQKEFLDFLNSLIDKKDGSCSFLLLSSLAALLLTSLSDAMSENDLQICSTKIVTLISSILSVQCSSKLVSFGELVKEATEGEVKQETNASLDNNFKEVMDILSAKRVALETLANIFSEAEDSSDLEEETMDCDEDWDDSDSLDGLQEVRSLIDPELEQVIVELGLLEKVVDHLDSPNEELKKRLTKTTVGKQVLENLEEVQRRALICINNMVQALPEDKSQHHFASLTKHITKFLVPERVSLLPEAVGALRSVIVSQSLSLPESDLLNFFNLVDGEETPGIVKMNVVKILGTLGAKSSKPSEIEMIATHLLKIANESATELTLKAEILDNVMDIFAEDDKTDELVVKLALISKLREIGKSFKEQVKAAKRRRDPIIETVSLNLNRFIKYKQSVGKK